MRKLTTYFLQGCLIVVPVVLTLYVVYLVVHKVDELLFGPVPGVGIVLSIALITAVGALASNVIGRALGKRLERLIARVPLVRLLYSTARDLMHAFFGENRSFEQPALVSLDGEGQLKALGFVTRESLSELGLDDHVLVYLPQSYNFAGNLLVLPASRVQALEIEAGQVMALVVSGGVVRGKQPGASEPPPALERTP